MLGKDLQDLLEVTGDGLKKLSSIFKNSPLENIEELSEEALLNMKKHRLELR